MTAAPDWTAAPGLPPFETIAAESFRPAFAAALDEARAEIEAIATDPADPDFVNTVEALERAGGRLDRVARAFFTLAGAQTDETIEAIQSEIAPELAKFSADVSTDSRLFARLDALMARRAALGLTPEQDRVLYLTHRGFVRAGARLDAPGRARMKEIGARLSALGVAFAQAVLAEERTWTLPLAEADLEGLPGFVVDAAAAAARERGLAGHVVTLSRSLIEPFLTFSPRRDLREIAYKAWIARGRNGDAQDTRAIAAETLALRRERARLLGYPDYAAFKLETEMAKTPEAARGLLERVWAPARARAAEEAERLAALAAEEGVNGPLEAWDWRYYAEKVRERDYALSETALKPYFSLDSMIDAAFDAAGRLFDLAFEEDHAAPRWHADVRVWRVTRGGVEMGLFYGDYFARASKRSGAWCSALRAQQKLDGAVRPVVVNICNFAKASEGPSLLAFDDAETLFHEFGHALHHLLSDVTYPSVSGTSVARDFVELPSQLFEHWLRRPEILAAHARHVETGAPIPADMIEKLKAAETFNQGFATAEFTQSALVDMALHAAEPPEDPFALEAEILAAIGAPRAIPPRHAAGHFQHVFSGDGYAAGYYSYMWSEVMDADAFAAFLEAGDPFDPETARRLEAEILSVGGSRDPDEAWRAFRGRAPDPQAMLEGRGLAA
jgi:peptidyl-dipeptidase Dcp